MNKEFLELYKNWYYSYCFNSVGPNLVNNKLIELELWCKNNKKEAIQCIIQVL